MGYVFCRKAVGLFSRSRLACAIALMAGVSALSGCRDVDTYALEPGETYCGSMVYSPKFTAGLVGEKEPPGLNMRLDFDVNNLSTVPGRITTDDAGVGICGPNGKALFDGAELRTIQEALHDPISVAKIGDGREQSFWTYVSSSCGHEMMAVVSLMHSGGIEVRLFKPAPEPTTEEPNAAEVPGFGLFVLEKKSTEACGF
jgi:hypothetical protein